MEYLEKERLVVKLFVSFIKKRPGLAGSFSHFV